MQSREESLLKLCGDSYALKNQDTLQKIKDFVSGGVNINCRDYQGRTPLHLAVENTSLNSNELVIFLLNNGANYKARSLLGKLPHEGKKDVAGSGGWNKEAVLVIEFSEKKEFEKEKLLAENSKNQLEIMGKMLKTIEEQNQLISDMKHQIIQLNQQLQNQPQLQSASQSTSTANPRNSQKFF